MQNSSGIILFIRINDRKYRIYQSGIVRIVRNTELERNHVFRMLSSGSIIRVSFSQLSPVRREVFVPTKRGIFNISNFVSNRNVK